MHRRRNTPLDASLALNVCRDCLFAAQAIGAGVIRAQVGWPSHLWRLAGLARGLVAKLPPDHGCLGACCGEDVLDVLPDAV